MLDPLYLLTVPLIFMEKLEALIFLEIFYWKQTYARDTDMLYNFFFITTFLALNELNVTWISQPMRYMVCFFATPLIYNL